MDWRHSLMQAQHDHRQPHTAQDKARERAALIDSRRCRCTNGLRDHTADWLQDHNGQRS